MAVREIAAIEIPLFEMEELGAVACRLRRGKSPGLDVVFNKAVAVESVPAQLLSFGVTIDKSLKFGGHIDKVCKRVVPTIKTIRRLFTEHTVPGASKRRLITSVVRSAALYAALVRAEAIRVQRNKEKLRSMHRTALLGVVAGYRTLSYEASYVLASVPPIDLQVRSRKLRVEGRSRAEAERK
ncbi:uncharacterized protein LOC142317841 [Lycorma delicatula]|uniref:uncharacterized protein LOC142317841 n=1 Tax=Lycorma delicatula TaxID=130591 RepID=UPI003F513DCD